MSMLAAQRSLQAAPPVSRPAEVCPERDQDWFEGVYAVTCESVYRYAHMLVREPFLAEDVTAETYLRAWRARHRFAERGSVTSWLLSIARNCALDELRKRRDQVQLDATADFEDFSESLKLELSETDVATIHEAIQRLTPEQQQVIFLRFYEELPHESVAVRLGRTPNAVRAIQFRALSRMRRLLEAGRAG
jgi:RNA polymerase sigma-70 factor (ECF subfamily)